MTELVTAAPTDVPDHAASAALLQRLHAESDAQTLRRARSQFQGNDAEFDAVARQYATLAPRLKGAFIEQYGLSGGDSEASQGTELALAVSPETGRFLHNMVLAQRPTRILELGSSCGASTLHMANALRRLGTGTVVATELDAAKCTQIREHTAAAGLTAYVDLREGDIFHTLTELDGNFGMVFMDMWATLYLSAFKQMEHLLQPGCIIVTDNMYTAGAAVCDYKAYLDGHPRYSSITMDFESGVEFTVVV